ncbi:unnamed protein product [Calypogeia fissa]
MMRYFLGRRSSSESSQASGSKRLKLDVRLVNDSFYEFDRGIKTPTLQVLFFHGLQFKDPGETHLHTWESGDKSCIWPEKWLVEDFPDAQILYASYDGVVNRSHSNGGFDMKIIGENLISDLMQANIGQKPSCPVILVGHCFGGVVIKQLCLEARNQLTDRTEVGMFLKNVKGIFYYNTPHHGSDIFDKFGDIKHPLWPYFQVLSKEGERLNQDFNHLCDLYSWEIHALGASIPVQEGQFKGFEVVKEPSARVGRFRVTKADHFGVCRPKDKTSSGYYSLKQLLDSCIASSAANATKAVVPINQCHGLPNQDLDSIPQMLKEESVHSSLMQESDMNCAMSTIVYDNDDKYVPIQKSQSKVITAIEDTDGSRMILLYGGLGKGKSTLARYMCKRYGQSGEKGDLFDHVILVACGTSSLSDLPTKQYEILEHLSPSSLTKEDSFKSAMVKPEEKTGSKSRIEKALQNFLIGKKILMVLDDVSDKRFLYKMWEAARDGKHHKILITSQRSYICDDFKNDTVLIPMGHPSEEEARKILASLVGLERKQIPENIQEIAEKMIRATDSNPLALACLASTFAYTQDKGNKRQWLDAWKGLSTVLDNEEMAIVVGQNDESPPRSLWGAMKVCIDSLETKEDAKSTLFLMYACKGESVPEEVLRILCAGMNMPNSTFNRSIGELYMRELLKCTDDTLASKMGLDESPSLAWSLLSLVKLYMDSYIAGKQEFSAVIGALLGDDKFSPEMSSKGKELHETEIVLGAESETGESDEKRINIILCALYFDRHHTDEVVKHAVSKACKKSFLEDSDNTINDLRKKAIEPLVWLLDKPEEEEQSWTEADKCPVRKVVLNYICKRQLDSKNILYLLKMATCPSAQLSTLKAISHISTIEEMPLLNKDTVSILQVLVDLLKIKEGVLASVQEAASKALTDICWKAARDKSASLVAKMAPVLDLFQHSLAITSKLDSFAENAARALAGLLFGQEEGIGKIVVNKVGIVATLVRFLYLQGKPNLQSAAALALSNLAYTPGTSLELLIIGEGALPGLVNCLTNHDHHELQTQAAWALANLAASRDESVKMRIVSEDGVLVGLVNCLTKHDHHELQTSAAWALANLAASRDESVEMRIVSEDGVLVGLVNCLTKHDHHELQMEAARALANLAASRDESMQMRIVSEDGVLVGLVNCLTKHDHHELQTLAAMALANLAASRDGSVKMRIVSEDGVLVGLVNCLTKHDHHELQTHAAWALANLAGYGDESVKMRIVSEDGVLVGLVNCLTKHDHHELQMEAARALANLAASRDGSVKIRIAGEDGFLVGLLNCLLKHDYNELQACAAEAIANLATFADARAFVKTADGLLLGLVSLVGDNVHPKTRQSAVQALFNLDMMLAKDVGLLSAQLDVHSLSIRIFVKAKLGDLEGALDDANQVEKLSRTMTDAFRTFALQERGVLKRIIGDLDGALADLDEGLELEPNDYERLKHRGYVKFLLNDMDAARTDAEWALTVRSSRAHSDRLLGTIPVEYLGYKL